MAHLEVGDRVVFRVKLQEELVEKVGVVTEVYSGPEAKKRRLIRTRQSGRVAAIREDGSGEIWHKMCKVLRKDEV